MKIIIKKLIREYFDDYEDFLEPIKSNSPEKLKKELDSLPDIVTLYRILVADSKELINVDTPGTHYSRDRKNLIKNHSFLKNNKYFLLTVEVPKKLIDMKQTIQNNMDFPTEKEISLKNKGIGSVVVNVEELN